MNTKKYLLATIAVFVVYSLAAYLIHQLFLAPDYEPLRGFLRPLEEFVRLLPLVYLGNLIFALAFCLIYIKGYEPARNWLGQGLRYGLLMGTLLAPLALTEFVVYPVPGALALKWIVLGYLQIVICALVVAGIYRTSPSGASR